MSRGAHRRLRHRAEVTPFVPPSVQPDRLVAMVTEKRHQDRSDIAPVAGYENSLWHPAIILCTQSKGRAPKPSFADYNRLATYGQPNTPHLA